MDRLHQGVPQWCVEDDSFGNLLRRVELGQAYLSMCRTVVFPVFGTRLCIFQSSEKPPSSRHLCIANLNISRASGMATFLSQARNSIRTMLRILSTSSVTLPLSPAPVSNNSTKEGQKRESLELHHLWRSFCRSSRFSSVRAH